MNNWKHNTRIPYFRRAVVQNFPFIANDFDALTDFGLLSQVVDYLNKVIEDTNNTTDNMNQLIILYNQLKEFVDNYFENLDVQEEINNKLDAMASDGTLTTLIGNYVQPLINEQNTNINNFENNVTNRLNLQDEDINVLESRMDTFTHLTEGSTSGDAELEDIRVAFNGVTYNTAGNATRGQANLVNELKTKVYPKMFNKKSISWTENKYISNQGNIIDNSTGWKISNAISIDSKYMIFDYIYQFGSNLTYSYLFNFYSSSTINNDNLVGSLNPDNAVASTICFSNANIIEVPENAKYLVISVIDSQLESINVYDTNLSMNFIKDEGIPYYKLDGMFYADNLYDGLAEGGTISNTGVISNSNTYKITDYISCDENTYYYRYNKDDIALVGYYDENKDWLSRGIVQANSDYFKTPANCAYFRFCDSNDDMNKQVVSSSRTAYFIPYDTEYSLQVKNSDLYKAIINQIPYNKLYGKNVCILGDSIAYGVGATDRTKDSWVALLGENTGANITNLAISGASLQYRESAESTAKSIYTTSTETDFSSYDYVIISAGTNDILANIGNPSDTVNTTACGALNLIVENILTSNPYAQIIFFGPMFRARFSAGDGHNSDDYAWQGKYVIDLADKLQETAEKNHVPAKNLYRTFMLNKYNSSILLSDGLHPNDLGYSRLYNCINDFININI